MDAIERVRSWVRSLMRHIARSLNDITDGHLTPNMVTWSGFVLHIGIGWLIIEQQFLWAGVWLIIFGLFDTLDGELARIQKRVSSFGMVLDATTDRLKEGILYGALAYHFAAHGQRIGVILSIVTLVTAFAVSYVKAKAETALATEETDTAAINRVFNEGLARFEIRMAVLAAGLLAGQLAASLWLLVIINSITFTGRLARIRQALN